MRYSYQGEVRLEYASLSYEEAATKAHKLISRSKGVFGTFREIVELYTVMQAAARPVLAADEWQEDFDFSGPVSQRNARPMEDLSKLYPASFDETA